MKLGVTSMSYEPIQAEVINELLEVITAVIHFEEDEQIARAWDVECM